MNRKLKKVLVSLGFVALQGSVLAAIAGISKGFGSIPSVQKIFYSDISQVNHWASEMGLGFLGLCLVLIGLAALGLTGYGIYRWGLWSYDTAEQWLKEAEYQRRRRARIRKMEQEEAARRHMEMINDGEVPPAWEM